MNQNRYHQWCLTFKDIKERNPSKEDDQGKGLVEADLSSLFYQLNLNDGERTGFINSDNILLLRKSESYEYATYFTLKGENSIGYNRMMFSNSKKPMIGIKKFEEYDLKLDSATKGKDAWKKFSTMMGNENYDMANKSTMRIRD